MRQALALVTGGTGFIGSALVRELVGRGWRVRALVRSPGGAEAMRALGAEAARGDVLDRAAVAAALAGATHVFHAAAMLKAPWRKAFVTENVEGTACIARACAEAATPPSLVLVSSLAAAGPSPAEAPRDEEDAPAPVSAYGRVKLACEAAAREHGERVPLTIVRPPMVFGEGDKTALGLFRWAARGLSVVPTRARRRISLVHVDDLVEVLIRSAEAGERCDGSATRGVYFSPGSEDVELGALAPRVARAMGRSGVRTLRLPMALTWVVATLSESLARLRDRPTFLNRDKARELAAGSWICNGAKAQRTLGWSPAPLDERLAQTAAGYRSRGLV